MENYVKELLDKGWSKYKIAKEMGVSWNTVHLWSKGVFKLSAKHEERYNEIKQ